MSSTNELLNQLADRIRLQDDYSEVNVGPKQGTPLDKEYNAILLASAASNLDIKDGTGSSVSFSANFLGTDTIYPIQITEIESSTGIAQSDIILLRR